MIQAFVLTEAISKIRQKFKTYWPVRFSFWTTPCGSCSFILR